MRIRFVLACLLLAAVAGAQQTPATPSPSAPPQTPSSTQQPPVSPDAHPPDTKAPPPKPGAEAGTAAAPANTPKAPDRANAYYHYSLAHMYEELAGLTSRADFISKAVDEYKLAMEADPGSSYLNAALAELYSKTGRIRDAVLEAQDIIKRDPKNIDARKLLGRIYLRSLGDPQSGTQSNTVLKLAIEQYEQIVKLEPKEVENHLLLGRLYRLANETAKAEAEFKNAVKLQPDSEDAVSSLAYLLNEENDPASAIQVLQSVPETARTAKVYAALGFTYEQQKDYRKAIEAYRKAVDQDSDNLDSVRGLAQNLLNDGQYEAALQQYKTIAEADPQDAQAQLRIAEIYRRMGRFQQALEALTKTETLVQDSLEVPYNKALVFEAQGKYDDAIRTYNELIQKTAKPGGTVSASEKNNRAVFLERLGSVYRDTGKIQLAIETFRKIPELGSDENTSRAYQQIIDTYRDQKQWQQATAAAREAVQKLPNDRSLKLVLASQLADVGEGDQALQQAKTLLKNNADDREVYLAIAQINGRLKRWKDAEEGVQKAISLSSKPEEKQAAEFVAGSLYERQKNFDEAEAMFKRVLAADPHNPMALNYLGYMLADRGVRLDEALKYVKEAVQLDPQNGAYLDSLGWAYFKQGNYELAEENLQKAVEHIANDATIHQHLGDLYQKTGRLRLAATHWERALDEWNKSVSADQDQAEMAKVQKKLEQARVRLAKQAQQAERKND